MDELLSLEGIKEAHFKIFHSLRIGNVSGQGLNKALEFLTEAARAAHELKAALDQSVQVNSLLKAENERLKLAIAESCDEQRNEYSACQRAIKAESENERLRDALDHIAKIAGMARTETKRLNWITARAKTALAGELWDNSYMPIPNVTEFKQRHQWKQEIESLREQLRLERESRNHLAREEARLEWIERKLFEHKWNGVIDSGSRTDWYIRGDYRHTTQKIVGHEFRDAIDAAILAERDGR